MASVSGTFENGNHSDGHASADVTVGEGTRHISVSAQYAHDAKARDPVASALYDHLAGGGASSGTVTVTVA
jgi:hypothetical protein